MPNRTLRLCGLLLAAFALGACSDETGPTNDPLTAQSAPTVGVAAASTADLALLALNPSVPVFGDGFPLLISAGRPLAPRPAFASPPEGCPTASDLTDSDGDGVPDNATWTFTAADCTRTDELGNSSVVTGSVAISDPGLTAGYTLELDDLTAAYFQSGALTPLLRLALDGRWALRGTSEVLSLEQQYNFALLVHNRTAELVNELDVTFTAASGAAISWGLPLPDGTLAIDGAWQLTAEEKTHSLTLATVEPLVYDDACGGIVAGVLVASGDGGEVRITWTGCGVHISEFTPN